MKKNKRLNNLVEKAVSDSFKNGSIDESKVLQYIIAFKDLTSSDAIYSLTQFIKGLKREKSKTELVIESTIPLTNDEINMIKSTVDKEKKITDTFVLTNPDLLGGIKVRVGDVLYDYSLDRKIKEIRNIVALNK